MIKCTFTNCKSSFTRKGDLTKHLKEFHNALPIRNIKCDHCVQVYTTKKDLIQHYATNHQLVMQTSHLDFETENGKLVCKVHNDPDFNPNLLLCLDFNSWKFDMEYRTNAFFVASSWKKTSDSIQNK